MVVPRHRVHRCQKGHLPDPAKRRSWTCPECGLRWEVQHPWPRRRGTWRPARHPDYGWLQYEEPIYHRWAQRQWSESRKKKQAKQEKRAQKKHPGQSS